MMKRASSLRAWLSCAKVTRRLKKRSSPLPTASLHATKKTAHLLKVQGDRKDRPYGWGNHKGYRNLLPGCKLVYNQGGFEPICIHSRKEDLHSWHYHK